MDRFIRVLWRAITALIVVGAIWIAADRWSQYQIVSERLALDARATELALRALAPGSPLACLDAIGNATVEEACEKALFASPETAAAAIAYADARLALLADGLRHAARDPAYAPVIERLRRGLEADRYGMVAQALASRGCTAEDCPALSLLRDPKRVLANLKERTFEANVVLHAGAWQKGAALAAADPQSPPPAASNTPSGVPVSSKYDFPSAASIPAISIMNAEPAPDDTATAAGPKPAASQPARSPPAKRPAPAREATTVGQPTSIVPLPPPAPALPPASR